jgi:hypothetical protein
MGWRYNRMLSCENTVTRYCPETGAEVEIDVVLRGTWFPGEPGNYYDPPLPPGVEDVWAEVHGGVYFQLTCRESDWAAELLGDGRD